MHTAEELEEPGVALGAWVGWEGAKVAEASRAVLAPMVTAVRKAAAGGPVACRGD